MINKSHPKGWFLFLSYVLIYKLKVKLIQFKEYMETFIESKMPIGLGSQIKSNYAPLIDTMLNYTFSDGKTVAQVAREYNEKDEPTLDHTEYEQLLKYAEDVVPTCDGSEPLFMSQEKVNGYGPYDVNYLKYLNKGNPLLDIFTAYSVFSIYNSVASEQRLDDDGNVVAVHTSSSDEHNIPLQLELQKNFNSKVVSNIDKVVTDLKSRMSEQFMQDSLKGSVQQTHKIELYVVAGYLDFIFRTLKSVLSNVDNVNATDDINDSVQNEFTSAVLQTSGYNGTVATRNNTWGVTANASEGVEYLKVNVDGGNINNAKLADVLPDTYTDIIRIPVKGNKKVSIKEEFSKFESEHNGLTFDTSDNIIIDLIENEKSKLIEDTFIDITPSQLLSFYQKCVEYSKVGGSNVSAITSLLSKNGLYDNYEDRAVKIAEGSTKLGSKHEWVSKFHGNRVSQENKDMVVGKVMDVRDGQITLRMYDGRGSVVYKSDDETDFEYRKVFVRKNNGVKWLSIVKGINFVAPVNHEGDIVRVSRAGSYNDIGTLYGNVYATALKNGDVNGIYQLSTVNYKNSYKYAASILAIFAKNKIDISGKINSYRDLLPSRISLHWNQLNNDDKAKVLNLSNMFQSSISAVDSADEPCVGVREVWNPEKNKIDTEKTEATLSENDLLSSLLDIYNSNNSVGILNEIANDAVKASPYKGITDIDNSDPEQDASSESFVDERKFDEDEVEDAYEYMLKTANNPSSIDDSYRNTDDAYVGGHDVSEEDDEGKSPELDLNDYTIDKASVYSEKNSSSEIAGMVLDNLKSAYNQKNVEKMLSAVRGGIVACMHSKNSVKKSMIAVLASMKNILENDDYSIRQKYELSANKLNTYMTSIPDTDDYQNTGTYGNLSDKLNFIKGEGNDLGLKARVKSCVSKMIDDGKLTITKKDANGKVVPNPEMNKALCDMAANFAVYMVNKNTEANHAYGEKIDVDEYANQFLESDYLNNAVEKEHKQLSGESDEAFAERKGNYEAKLKSLFNQFCKLLKSNNGKAFGEIIGNYFALKDSDAVESVIDSNMVHVPFDENVAKFLLGESESTSSNKGSQERENIFMNIFQKSPDVYQAILSIANKNKDKLDLALGLNGSFDDNNRSSADYIHNLDSLLDAYFRGGNSKNKIKRGAPNLEALVLTPYKDKYAKLINNKNTGKPEGGSALLGTNDELYETIFDETNNVENIQELVNEMKNAAMVYNRADEESVRETANTKERTANQLGDGIFAVIDDLYYKVRSAGSVSTSSREYIAADSMYRNAAYNLLNDAYSYLISVNPCLLKAALYYHMASNKDSELTLPYGGVNLEKAQSFDDTTPSVDITRKISDIYHAIRVNPAISPDVKRAFALILSASSLDISASTIDTNYNNRVSAIETDINNSTDTKEIKKLNARKEAAERARTICGLLEHLDETLKHKIGPDYAEGIQGALNNRSRMGIYTTTTIQDYVQEYMDCFGGYTSDIDADEFNQMVIEEFGAITGKSTKENICTYLRFAKKNYETAKSADNDFIKDLSSASVPASSICQKYDFMCNLYPTDKGGNAIDTGSMDGKTTSTGSLDDRIFDIINALQARLNRKQASVKHDVNNILAFLIYGVDSHAIRPASKGMLVAFAFHVNDYNPIAVTAFKCESGDIPFVDGTSAIGINDSIKTNSGMFGTAYLRKANTVDRSKAYVEDLIQSDIDDNQGKPGKLRLIRDAYKNTGFKVQYDISSDIEYSNEVSSINAARNVNKYITKIKQWISNVSPSDDIKTSLINQAKSLYDSDLKGKNKMTEREFNNEILKIAADDMRDAYIARYEDYMSQNPNDTFDDFIDSYCANIMQLGTDAKSQKSKDKFAKYMRSIV